MRWKGCALALAAAAMNMSVKREILEDEAAKTTTSSATIILMVSVNCFLRTEAHWTFKIHSQSVAYHVSLGAY